MGKPRLIILVRHGQSEGNKNRDIHQFIPDHRVKLTPEGWGQAEDAGKRLRKLLRKEDTIRIFTSPYRRTRETTEGILRTLTADDDDGPSPFQRDDIKVDEEPRLREQDFGNFQPCSIEMDRIWQERAAYGHFYFRIPSGESAADAYDRVSGFNESLWRQFSYDDFPSVCVIVTHGLMTRVFLMKWYRWTPEYFEDLRNLNHCEFSIMEKNEKERFELLTKLRTWSDYHAERGTDVEGPPSSPKLASFRWGGCSQGCQHHNMSFPRRVKRASMIDREGSKRDQALIQQRALKAQEEVVQSPIKESREEEDDAYFQSDHPKSEHAKRAIGFASPTRTISLKKLTSSTMLHPYELHSRPSFAARAKTFSPSSSHLSGSSHHHHYHHHEHPNEEDEHHIEEKELNSADEEEEDGDDEDAEVPGLVLPAPSRSRTTVPKTGQAWSHTRQYYLAAGRDGGGSESGIGSPAESDTDTDSKPRAGSSKSPAVPTAPVMDLGEGLTAEPGALKTLPVQTKRSSSPLRHKATAPLAVVGQHPLRKVASTEEEEGPTEAERSESIDAKAGGTEAVPVAKEEGEFEHELQDGEGTAVGDIY